MRRSPRTAERPPPPLHHPSPSPLLCTVAYETRGHTYFVEDGLETKNIITGNLAAVTRPLFVGLSTDATPSSYWLVNGDNYVANNIAAGSSHCALLLAAVAPIHHCPTRLRALTRPTC